MEINICINGNAQEVSEILSALQTEKFKEINDKLLSLKNKVGSLEKNAHVTDATLYKLQTGELKMVDFTVK